MTDVFLGYPPEHIKKWIKEHSQTNPPVGAERWVPACNPDGTPLSNTSSSEWINEHGYTKKFTFNESSGMWDDCAPDTDKETLMLSDFDDTSYRVYIPGHWEDADGNWVNGSWSNMGENGGWEGISGILMFFMTTE